MEYAEFTPDLTTLNIGKGRRKWKKPRLISMLADRPPDHTQLFTIAAVPSWLSTSYVCSKWMRMDLEQYNTMSYGSQFNMNCTNFTEHDWIFLNLVRSIAATLGAVIILVLLLFLICYKAYSSLFQRLYLYLIIVTLLNEMTGIVSIEHQWQYERQETVCMMVGFFLAWTYVLLFIFSYEIILYLLYLVTSKICETRLLRIGPRCYGAGVAVEATFIVLPVLISTAFALPPLLMKPCLLYTSPSPRDATLSRMPSSA